MNTIQKFKLRRIVKALLGTLLNKGWNWLSNATLVAAIAESPAVMTASGWTIDPKTGKAKQDSFNTPERNKLAGNLATIGEAGVTAPTLAGDIEGLYNVVRHPVLTYNAVKSAVTSGVKTGKEVVLNFKNRDRSVIAGPNTPVSSWDLSEPEKIQWTSQQLKTLFNKRKEDVINYVNGLEFRLRVMNTGKFTEKDYKDLIKEIEYVINKSHYAGRQANEGATNTYRITGKNSHYDSYITLHDNHSLTLLRANIWHELWHSIGGRNNYRDKNQFPLLYKLLDYNNSLKVDKSKRLIEYEQDTGSTWYADNILNRNREIRSRASVFLNFLREKGYDTEVLLKNPDKLNDSLNDIKSKRVQVPWDIRLLLLSIDYPSLKGYLSKVLGASAGIYTINNNLNNYE